MIEGGVKMKKVYEAPEVEIELYELDASIASNCEVTVTFDPEQCPDMFPGGEFETYSMRSTNTPVFYEDSGTCDCYYNSNGGTYFNS